MASGEMNKLEIDPKLFITCRLCLEEMGLYQIVPCVQQQIKFCFDFDVDPFDGLPQLICKGCESILSQFNSIKKKFQDKQNELQSRGCNTNSTPLQQQNIVTSTEQNECQLNVKEELDTIQPKSFKLTLKRKHSNSSVTKNDAEQESESCASSYSIVQKPSRARTSKPSRKWRKQYDKYFVCRFCSNSDKDKKVMFKHMKEHGDWCSKYLNLIKKCSISISPIDKKPNMTGLLNTVMIDHDRIIQNSDASFAICYKRQTEYCSDNEINQSHESSDDDIIRKKTTKRLRLISASSNETVILEDSTKKGTITEPQGNNSIKSNLKSTVIDCVAIDDSTDSDNNNEEIIATDYIDNNQIIAKIIANTVTGCFNKFINKQDSSENFKCKKENPLLHKILSLGRRVINKRKFSCNGVLRYLEHKHLEVNWNEILSKNKISDYAYVRTKVIESRKNGCDKAWKSLSEVTEVNENFSLNTLLQQIHKFDSHFAICNVTPVNTPSPATLSVQTVSDYDSTLKKLLNPNPVANPKQLPKKTHLQENPYVKVVSGPSSIGDNIAPNMPIITSTVSLASISNHVETEKSTEDNTSCSDANSLQPFVSRIKVKPVSQLMAVNSSNSTGIGYGFASVNNWNVPVSNDAQAISNQHIAYGVANTSQTQSETRKENEYVVLHTVEIPNQITMSPFIYLKNLLQIHNLILIDSNATVTTNFHCLVKFKSIFKQENQVTGVTLCMSLFSDTKQFCIKIRDNSAEIDIKRLPPHWQWEILQLFRGNIADKLIANAMKAGKKMFEVMNYFVSLLRSIVFSKHKGPQ